MAKVRVPEDPQASAIYTRFREALRRGYPRAEAVQYANTGVDPRQDAKVAKPAAVKPQAPSNPVPMSEPEPEPEVTSSVAPQGNGSVDQGDDLTQINGIGSRTIQRLNDLGVTQFSQIAGWSEDEAKDFDEKLNLRGRILREDWVGQARNIVRSWSA